MGRETLIRFNKSEKHRKQLIEYNKSEKHRKIASKVGKLYGKFALIKYNKSEEGRKAAIEKGRKMGKKYGGKNLAKANSYVPTESQKSLSKALSDNGIDNQLEWWIPECRRIIDIAILSNKIAIEVDGSSHDGIYGRGQEQTKADDKLKDQQLQSLGWKVLRFSNEDVKNRLQEIIKKVDIFV